MATNDSKTTENPEWDPVSPKHQNATPDIYELPLPDEEDAVLAQLQKNTWTTLNKTNTAIKNQLSTIFDQIYNLIPNAIKELDSQLKSLKTDKTSHMILQNKVKTEWKSCQDDLMLILENAYLDVFGQEFASDSERHEWEIAQLGAHLGRNLSNARIKQAGIRRRISQYTKGLKILKQHKNRMLREQKKFQRNPLLNDAVVHLEDYIHTLRARHFNLFSHLLNTPTDKHQQLIIQRETEVFKRFAHDIFHQKPTLANKLRSVYALAQEEIENVLFTKAEYFAKQKSADQPKRALVYQTEEEKQERLLKLLKDQTPAIQGEQMDFTFLPAALQEFSKYPDEYQQEAVKKLQRVMNIPLEMGSRTVIAGHQVIDKMRDYDLHKIRVINYNIGEDNLPRIMLKPLPSKGDRERWCVVGFSDEGHQKRQYARFAKREVLPWPTDPSKIVIFNPPQIATGPVPTPVPVPGGNGRA